MIILGIESTAHTFGVGIIKASPTSCKVLANEKSSFTSKDSGMIPDEIIEHHKVHSKKILSKALKTANIDINQIKAIAYSAGPGIDPILWVGYHFAKALSETNEIPLIPVNHCAAHLSIGKIINKAKKPIYLYVSGVNTQIIIQEQTRSKTQQGKYHILGETLDIGLGNMLDKFARILGLGFPGGPIIEKLAKKGKFIKLPYSVKGMDSSFSGLLTKCKQLYERNQATKLGVNQVPRALRETSKVPKTKFEDKAERSRIEDLCFSIQEHAFAQLTEIAERALAHTKTKELILVGGVGANKRFCQMLEQMTKDRGATFYNVPMNLAGDQGVMIAWEGFLRQNENKIMEVNAHWRTDEL